VARRERYLVGLDVGTSKVTAVVAEILSGEGLDVVGLGAPAFESPPSFDVGRLCLAPDR